VNYQKKMEGQLEQWGVRHSLLASKVESSSEERKKLLLPELAKLEVLEAAGRRHLSTVEGASVAAWDEMKTDLAETWNYVSGSIDAIWARVK